MANHKHRVLVIGVGSIGERHTRCFLRSGRAHVGICELNAETRERVSNAYELTSAYADLEAALAQPWDVILIATPAHMHIPIARRALETGAALLIEKPLSIGLEGIPEFQDEVRRRGTIVAVSYNYRAHPGLRAMKSALESGELGKPLQIVTVIGQDFAKYRPAYRDVYFADPAAGGGALQDATTHYLNLGEWLIGPITQVAADASHQHLPGVTVEDTVSILTRHGSASGVYSINLYQKPNEMSVTAVCERGVLRFELHEQRLRRMTESDGPWEDEPYPLSDRDEWYVRNANAFLDAVEGKAEPLCTLDDGVQTLRVTLAAQRSIQANIMKTVAQ